jgi:hypothetical protein
MGAINWITKSKTVTFQVPYQGSKLLRGGCDKKSLNSLEDIYQEAEKGIVEAQMRFVDEWPSYEKKCNWIDRTKNKANFEVYRRLYKDLSWHKRIIPGYPNRIKDARINELRRKIIESKSREYLTK